MHHSEAIIVRKLGISCTQECSGTILGYMTTTPEGQVPVLTLGDRLHTARTVLNRRRREQGKKPLSIGEFAEEVGVHRNTITRYEQNETRPSKGDLMLWASVCDFPLGWFLEQAAPGSNREPADFADALGRALIGIGATK